MDMAMVDVAHDLMHDIERVDAEQGPEAKARRERMQAAVMLQVGFSEDEVVAKLGYLPEPFPARVRPSGHA